MEYYNSNMEALKKGNKKLYSCIQADNTFSGGSMKLYIAKAKNDSSIMGLNVGNREISLNSRYHPEHEAQIWEQGLEWKGYENILIMFGLANGYYVRSVMHNENSSKILVYEPSKEIFYFALHNFDMRDILESDKVLLSVEGLNEEMFQYNLAATLTIRNMRTVQRRSYPWYEELFLDSYKKYLTILGAADRDKRTDFNTMQHFHNSWMENYCNNLKFLKGSSLFEEAVISLDRNVPVIIVSAGPSVKEELEGLRMAKNHLPIFAVDRIVDFLIENGVEPDGIFTIDAHYRKSLLQVEKVQDIPIICGMTASGEITQNHAGKKILISDDRFLADICLKMGKPIRQYETGTTVSSLAFAAFAGQQFKEIILVGQDLSFDGEYSHAGEVKEELPYMKKEYNIEGIHGTTVRTRDDWYTMLHWYNAILAKYTATKVYDAKCRGAKIMHTTNIRLKEFIESRQWDEKEYREMLLQAPTAFRGKEWRILLDEFYKGLKDLKTGKEKAKKAIECCERLIRGLEEHIEITEEDKKDIDMVQEANRFFEQQKIFILLSSYIENYVREAMYALGEKEGDILIDGKKAYMAAIIQMQAVWFGVDHLYPKLWQAVKEME